MSQATDYTIDNSTGANVRSDINTVLGAIATNNSGGSDNGSIQALGFFANTSSSQYKYNIPNSSVTTKQWVQSAFGDVLRNGVKSGCSVCGGKK